MVWQLSPQGRHDLVVAQGTAELSTASERPTHPQGDADPLTSQLTPWQDVLWSLSLGGKVQLQVCKVPRVCCGDKREVLRKQQGDVLMHLCQSVLTPTSPRNSGCAP